MNANSKIKLNMDALKTSKEWVRHKVKSGHNVFRVLPPFGEASNGYPYRKWQIIWGLQDPESGRMRPYASPLMTEKRCPVVELTDELKERLAKIDGDLKARGLDEKAVHKHPVYARLATFIKDFTPKTTYIYNAVDKSGVVGLLELKSTAHKDMKTQMNQYIQDYNQDPTSLNSADDDSGVWFDVIRSGEGFNTEYKVEKVQTKTKLPTGGISFVDDRSPLPEAVVANFGTLAYDLSSVYKATTYDEVNEVLQANLDRLYELCPEANLSNPVDLDAKEVAPPAKAVVAPKVAASKPVAAVDKAKVALRLKDEDDEETVAKPTRVVKVGETTMDADGSATSTFMRQSVEDDDFMKQADAILNG